jgi:hypothetical protein
LATFSNGQGKSGKNRPTILRGVICKFGINNS